MPPIRLLIKPASGNCNMRCSYCFYADESRFRSDSGCARMSDEMLETVLRKAFEYSRGRCAIAYQGGEPTLCGTAFFQRAAQVERKYAPGAQIHHAIQTNGLLLDKEWLDFLAAEQFLVGLSLDGPKALHDRFRRTLRGEGSYARVLSAAQKMQQRGIPFNILTVLTAPAARDIERIYSFFRRCGFFYQQYIPCLDPMDRQRGSGGDSLLPEQYRDCLFRLFALWERDCLKGQPVSVRFFDDLLAVALGYPPEECSLHPQCAVQYVVEADGSVYPCDFYTVDRWKLGNLQSDSFEQLDRRRTELGFIEESGQTPESCKVCEWFWLCRGGCRRDREFIDGHSGLKENYYCAAYRDFFEMAVPRLRRLAALR